MLVIDLAVCVKSKIILAVKRGKFGLLGQKGKSDILAAIFAFALKISSKTKLSR